MEDILNTPPAPSAAQVATPTTPEVVASQPAAIPSTPVHQYSASAASSSTSGSDSSIMDTIKSFNPVEIFFGIIGTAALFYAIYYFKNQKSNQLKIDAIQAKLDELVINQSDLSGKIELLNADKQQSSGGFI